MIDWPAVLQGGAIGLLITVVIGIFNMNTKLTRMEMWQNSHEKLDDARHLETRQDRSDAWKAIDGLREAMRAIKREVG